MKEHPILFSGEMVKAILEGCKTQTRRVLSPNNSYPGSGTWKTHLYDFDRARIDGPNGLDAKGNEYLHVAFCNRKDGWEDDSQDDTVDRVRCKWKAGDRLWVKETHAFINIYGAEVDCADATARQHKTTVLYRASDCYTYRDGSDGFCQCDEPSWKPSIFMPRWASRITLEIVSVRVQRLQDISDYEVLQEGCDFPSIPDDVQGGGEGWMGADRNRVEWQFSHSKDNFVALWDSINAKKYPWESNPWVWAIEFRRIQ